jgi:nucleoside-diphosphate-sugar epimerase
MRVLLAGASGAIGHHLIPILIEAKHEVVGITRTPGSLAGTGATEIVADALDRAALLAALAGVRADAVVHQLTSLTKPPISYKDMRVTNRLRAEGTSTLIAAARIVGAKKFVAASFFGGYGFRDLGRTPLTESAPFGEPDNRNDAALLALLSLEQQVHAFGGVSLRYGLFYDSTTTAVSPVSRSWDGVVPMVHHRDAARAVVAVLSKYKPGAVYNIADDHPLTYRDREIARAEAANLRPPRELSDGLLRLGAPFGSMLLTRTSMVLDSSRARAELGWTPEFPSLLECLGVSAPDARSGVVVPIAVPATVADADADADAPELESAPVLQPGLGQAPQLEPERESEPEQEPAPEQEPEPEPESQPEPQPEPEPQLEREPAQLAEPAHAPVKAPARPRVSKPKVTAPEPTQTKTPSKPPAKPRAPRPRVVNPKAQPPASTEDVFNKIDAAIARIGHSDTDDPD